jgi:hypothetical protein
MTIGVQRNKEKYSSSPATLGNRIVVKRTKETGELEPEPGGPGKTDDAATQFDTSHAIFGGGSASKLTQGPWYKPPAESFEGGMS